MIFTGTGVAFLLLVMGVLPFLAIQTAKRLGDRPLPISRERLFGQVIGTQAFIFAIAWFTARENAIDLWTAPRMALISWTAAAVLLAVTIAGLRLRWPGRTAASKARLYSMLPRNERERLPYAGVCIAAGIAEEIVYRGVLTTLLQSYTRSLPLAVVVSAIVFGVSHSLQGTRAVLATALIALVMQALVIVAHSLIPAMVVHALYDFVAGILIPRWYEEEMSTSSLPLDGVAASGR